MRVARPALVMTFCALVAVLSGPVYTAPSIVPAYQRFLSPASPLEVVALHSIVRARFLDWMAR